MNLCATTCHLGLSLVLVGGLGSVQDPVASAPDEPRRGPGEQAAESEGYIRTADGVRLHYRVMGEGEQTVVVPVGFYLADALRPLAEERRLVFYDPRGRGRSDAVDTSRVSLEYQMRDLETLRRSLGIERMALIGSPRSTAAPGRA